MSNSSVLAFPLYRRRKLVHGIAQVLSSTQGEAANLFWRKTAQQLLHQLAASGLPTAAAEEEVRTLLQVVLAEMQEIVEGTTGSSPRQPA